MTDLRSLRPVAIADAALALPALRALRPHSPATASAEGLQTHLRAVEPEGYRLTGAFEAGRPEAAAIAGYRVITNLWEGRTLYLDDLSTVPDARGRGHAGALLDWLDVEARRLDCVALHLDSGTGATRFAAHRLYHAHGLTISAHHFSKALGSGEPT
ncbi:GNAT family N-acetyltransferase [Deinococcus sp. KSM4-11]|uniref:GNAT family N-acetyltransferase n=1 Tax=Deinococcus sp. KSM4-11 TaxID=2568654 RepID=UPI0010A4F051|nr:GNAT family N-acetyltransferase [Deinococcus sp. KSM4-11]THF87889.1 GNAT family N-acetyltransferase [Deinococcus sp. KSM4-11]